MENTAQTNPTPNVMPNVDEDQMREYWNREFGISPAEMAEAARAGEAQTETIEKFVQRVQYTA